MNNQASSHELYIDMLLIWGVPVLLLLVALMLQWPVIKKILSEYRLMKVIKKYGRETMHDVMLPDGLGDFTYIEHLALTSNAIVVLYLKRYRGVIFAGEQINEWTQVLNNHSYRFPNPLQQLEMDVMAIRSLIPDANIEGKVVFTRQSSFPKGKPGDVILINELEKQLKGFAVEEIPPSLKTAWKRLQEKIEPCSKEFILSMRESSATSRHGLLSGLLVVIAGSWLLWHMV